jgi:hypothetical protein
LTVSEADIGRLEPGQMGPVNQARQEWANSRDNYSRSHWRLKEAQTESRVAKDEQQQAALHVQAAGTEQKAALDSSPSAQEKAGQLQEQASAKKQVADARLDYTNKLVSQRNAEMQAAYQRLAVADKRLNWSKLQALEQAQNPAAMKYDSGRFQTAVNDSQREFDKAKQQAHDLEIVATAARQHWEDAQRRLQPQTSSSEMGTGSGK